MKKTFFSLFCAILFSVSIAADPTTYQPNWNSLNQRPIPAWYDDAKFGIFVVWGLYSVPAWAPPDQYAEWYWHRLMHSPNKSNNTNENVRQFHNRVYGEDFHYPDFAQDFKAEMFNPGQWAQLFKQSGANYVVMTAQYHDGFCLWKSPYAWNWNSVDIGPKRDLVGDLTKAIRDAGLKMGYYYSLYEWFHPFYQTDIDRFVKEHMHPQIKHLVETYKPSILWADGEWEKTSEVWRTPELIAWLYNQSSVKNQIVINDRWGKDCRGKHGGFYTLEFGGHTNAELGIQHKWEENRGMGHSYGYNRNERIEDYSSPTQLIHLLIDTVAHGGNLLLDVGPTADGRIPVIMQERLVQIGEWLDVNGEAIFETNPWRVTEEGEPIPYQHSVKIITHQGWKLKDETIKPIRYTMKKNSLYAITLHWPKQKLILKSPGITDALTIDLLGYPEPLEWEKTSEGYLLIHVPNLSIDEMPCQHAYVFKLTGIE